MAQPVRLASGDPPGICSFLWSTWQARLRHMTQGPKRGPIEWSGMRSAKGLNRECEQQLQSGRAPRKGADARIEDQAG